jgi:hypothetical protein
MIVHIGNQDRCHEGSYKQEYECVECGSDARVEYRSNVHMYKISHGRHTLIMPFKLLALEVDRGNNPVTDWLNQVHSAGGKSQPI